MIGKSLMEQHYPKKKNLFDVEEITYEDYKHGERVCKDFEIEKLGEYHDLYLKS